MTEVNVSRGTTVLDDNGNVVKYANDQFFKYKRATIPREAVDGINEYLSQQDLKWEDAKFGSNLEVDENTRKSKISWINDDGLKSYIFSQFESANSDPDWQFELDAIEDIQYTKYEGHPDNQFNGHYDWHYDYLMAPDERKCRKLSMTVMLSQRGDEYEGGSFEFQCLKNGSVQYQTLDLEIGDILVFPSMMHHRVNFTSHGERKVLVAWAWGPLFK